METLCITERPALQRLYNVAGRTLLIDSCDSWSANVFSRVFEGWHTAEAESSRVPDCVIRVERDLSPPHVPQHFVGFELPGDGIWHSDGDVVFIEFYNSLIRVGGTSSAKVRVWLCQGLQPQSTSMSILVSYAVSAALRRCGVLELHSGGVCEPSSGKGALIVGASGSGKSTLTLQLAAAGWQYLSDDVLMLTSQRYGVEAWGLRRDFAVTDETLNASGLSGLRENVGWRASFDPEKWRFSPAQLFPRGHVSSCVPDSLFFPVITGESESRIEELSQPLAMSRLIRMCPWAAYDKRVAEHHLEVLAELARQTMAFVLFAGKDLLRDRKLAPELILSRL